MQYRVQFLDSFDNVIREVRADARTAGFPLLMARPPRVNRARVIYPSAYVSTSKPLKGLAALLRGLALAAARGCGSVVAGSSSAGQPIALGAELQGVAFEALARNPPDLRGAAVVMRSA